MVKVQKKGRTWLYSINEESPLVKRLEDFDNTLIESMGIPLSVRPDKGVPKIASGPALPWTGHGACRENAVFAEIKIPDLQIVSKPGNVFHWNWYCCSCKANSVQIKFNQGLIDPDKVFDRDRDRDWKMITRVWWKNFNHSLLKIFQSRCGCQKLTRFAAIWNVRSWRKQDRGERFSIKVCPKNFNQGVVENFQSGFDWKMKSKVWLFCEMFLIAVVIVIENFEAGFGWKSWIWLFRNFQRKKYRKI